MANTARNVAMAMMAAAVLATPGTSAAADAGTVPDAATRVEHVRSTNPALVALIQQATERSATFRAEVETINASDSFVFVEEGNCHHRVRACVVSLTASKSHRFLRVFVDTHKADWDLMGSIGHELRHTIEIIDEPGIRTGVAMFMFYERAGVHSPTGAHETDAAIDAGNTIRSEIKGFNRHSKSE